MQITKLMIQNLLNPLGLGLSHPCFSYQLDSEKKGDEQTAYQILAASKEELLTEERADLWNSGKVQSTDNFAIPYDGSELKSRQEIYWRVRVWDAWGQETEWSTASRFELGLLKESDWIAGWIGQGDDFDGNKATAPAFAGSFQVRNIDTVKKARAYISGLGLFIASLNGKPLSDNLFEPGESEFNRRVFYITYDITAFLSEGENVLGVILGNGQYENFAAAPVMKMGDGTLCWNHRYQKDDTVFLKNGICGNKKLIVQVELTRIDGTIETALVSNETWKITDSPITFQNWYGGEDYDAQAALKNKGWDMPCIDRTDWTNAVPMAPPKGKLSAREFLPIQIEKRWRAKSVVQLPNGNWLVDMGINFAGFPVLKLKDTKKYAGRKVKMYPAEILKPDGSGVDQASSTQSCDTLFSCSVKDCYTIAGTGEEEWHPVFCYHGFQYVEVAGFPGIPTVDNFDGCAVRVMNEKYSDFKTNNDLLNKINEITDRSIESNMMSSFTDCPQIEKLGWLETTHLMFSAMAAGYDIRSWIPKIVQDMQDAQISEDILAVPPMEADSKKYPGFDFKRLSNKETEGIGFIPAIAPEYHRIGRLFKDPNWGGAGIMTPWYYYLEYGDAGMLKSAYPMMCGYLEHLKQSAHNGILKGYAHMGEWGQLNENTPVVLVATCAFYLQTVTVSKVSQILGEKEKEKKYLKLAETIRAGFYEDKECYQPDKETYGNDSQASYGCALFSGIIKPEKKEAALMKLLEAINRAGDHLTSGEVGLKQVFHALASAGKNDVVYRMVMNPTEPSYRHHVDQGLTTLPEFWNYTELWNGLGRSRNHAMMGHVKEWIFRFVLGIKPLEPGYRKIEMKPYIQENINSIKGSVFTVRGKVKLSCCEQKGGIEMEVVIPVGSRADIYIPCKPEEVLSLEGEFGETGEVLEEGYIRISNIPSGSYRWRVKRRKV
ncbi:alpha-L-rhamnosidase [Anaerocolumna sp. MB42-C2]|uniref:alpha-L-rhamnosidase n=1 Tax=Anaerocolumna sp. MB42-C2 TaxID=3070997 RepID=UPI0027E010FF|nr:alpha-L-rhamnosidase [Anaerocolumna sp. MB42-C2]WMJ86880.1 family 78 glycoside hydrolase catalytic domain [Anaerocolumna sp. MB42-C2]